MSQALFTRLVTARICVPCTKTCHDACWRSPPRRPSVPGTASASELSSETSPQPETVTMHAPVEVPSSTPLPPPPPTVKTPEPISMHNNVDNVDMTEPEAPVAEVIAQDDVASLQRAVAQLTAPNKDGIKQATEALERILEQKLLHASTAGILDARMSASSTGDARLALFYLCDSAAKLLGTRHPVFFNDLLLPLISKWFDTVLTGNNINSSEHIRVRDALYRMVCAWNARQLFLATARREWLVLFEARMNPDARAIALNSSTSRKRRAVEATEPVTPTTVAVAAESESRHDAKRSRTTQISDLLAEFNKPRTPAHSSQPQPTAAIAGDVTSSTMEALAGLQRLLSFTPAPSASPPCMRNLLQSIGNHPAIQQLMHAPAPSVQAYPSQHSLPYTQTPPLSHAQHSQPLLPLPIQYQQYQQQQQQQYSHPPTRTPYSSLQRPLLHRDPSSSSSSSSSWQSISLPAPPAPAPVSAPVSVPVPGPWDSLQTRSHASTVSSLHEGVKYRCKTCQMRIPTPEAMSAHMEIHFAEHKQRRTNAAAAAATAANKPVAASEPSFHVLQQQHEQAFAALSTSRL
jgi:hypothetical protein